MKRKYKNVNISSSTRDLIEKANEIIREYIIKKFRLTLRQLYYQFVARDMLKNSDRNYKLLGRAINTGRMVGLIDWGAIEDRTRFPRSLTHWDSIKEIVESAIWSYRIDKWKTTLTKVEVWVEKDALIDIVERVCDDYDVTCFSCRGYVSQTAMREAALRFIEKSGWIIHLGDHDPSGIDMSRDIQKRLDDFGATVIVDRVALNMSQIELHKPPPNPAKITDSRAKDYIKKHGNESWELDALPPEVLAELVETSIKKYWNEKAWGERKQEEDASKERMRSLLDGIDF
jgi:hypothetical protein